MNKSYNFKRQPKMSLEASGFRRKRRGRFALVFFPFLVAVHVAGANEAQNVASYDDDTFEILGSGVETQTLNGNFGYERYQYSESADGEQEALDARQADFIVAISRNANPTYESDCERGSQPVNRYPLNVYYSDMTAVVGGIVIAEVPQDSDWEPTYCNSAAVHFKYAPAGLADGIRITGAWDAFRMAADSPGLTIKNSWLSDVRDDALENDYFYSTVFEDNLVDGAFQGISIHSGGALQTGSAETVVLTGNVIRLREYLYKGEQRFGALFKNEVTSPRSKIHDTVVAVDYRGGSTWNKYWERSWSQIDSCSNNVFLWLSDLPVPTSFPPPPSSCFTVVTGHEARDMWAQAKQNWINCHPLVRRTDDDPRSDASQCVANTFGGYSRSPSSPPLPPRFIADL